MSDDWDPATLDAYDRRMLGLVEKFGFAVQGVFPDTNSGGGEPGFCYTVGLAAQRLPELILFGLPPTVAQSLLNDLGSRMRAGTTQVAAGDTVWGLVRGYPVRLVEVTDSREHLTISNRFAGGPSAVAALQVVFPDAQGRWPWESESGVSGLPVLGPVPAEGREVRLPDPGQN